MGWGLALELGEALVHAGALARELERLLLFAALDRAGDAVGELLAGAPELVALTAEEVVVEGLHGVLDVAVLAGEQGVVDLPMDLRVDELEQFTLAWAVAGEGCIDDGAHDRRQSRVGHEFFHPVLLGKRGKVWVVHQQGGQCNLAAWKLGQGPDRARS